MCFGVGYLDVFIECLPVMIGVPLGYQSEDSIVQVIQRVLVTNHADEVGASHHLGCPQLSLCLVSEGAFVLILTLVVVAQCYYILRFHAVILFILAAKIRHLRHRCKFMASSRYMR